MKKSYSYWHVKPSVKPPFEKVKRHTYGKFSHITQPMGVFGFRYAVFTNRRSEVLVPTHDLTPETRAAIEA